MWWSAPHSWHAGLDVACPLHRLWNLVRGIWLGWLRRLVQLLTQLRKGDRSWCSPKQECWILEQNVSPICPFVAVRKLGVSASPSCRNSRLEEGLRMTYCLACFEECCVGCSKAWSQDLGIESYLYKNSTSQGCEHYIITQGWGESFRWPIKFGDSIYRRNHWHSLPDAGEFCFLNSRWCERKSF